MIYFITGNKGKFEEAQKLIPSLKQYELDLEEIQSLDPEEVIRHKLLEAFKHKKGEFIVEDTSLFIDSLNSLPGTLTKWFLKSIDIEGIYKLAKLFGTQAHAITLIGYAQSPTKIKYYKGEIKGKIVPPKGKNGFGWDKIFMPNGYKKTFAQMTTEDKNKLSMRRLAFKKLAKYLQSQ